MSTLNPAAIKVALPALLEVMKPQVKWQTKMGSLKMLSSLADACQVEVSICLPDIVPAVTECMTDIKKELRDCATETLIKCCAAVGNKDIEPFIPNLIRSIAEPDQVQDCVHKLGATTFVQAVSAATLAIMVPLLLRGLAERSTPIRRKSALVIYNMAELVDSPTDALEFVNLLKPHVEKAFNEMSNPEARGVCEKALKKMDHVANEAQKAGATGQPGAKADREAMRQQLAKAVADVSGATLGADATASLNYVADMCATLVDVKNFEEEAWTSCVTPYLGPYITEASAGKAAKAFLDVCFQEAESKIVVEEEEGEDLCNCEFSLAYGAKVLLMNANLHLKRGQRYGLCGPNGAGKSTLMRAIANGQLDGFPPKEELRTVYVEHDIDASEADTPVVEFVYADPILQDASHPSHGKVEEVLTSVGFTPELQASPVASLSGGWKMKLALARAMLMEADILLLDEPTNHLDVTNVQWLVDYLTSLKDVTSMIVSHDSGFLDKVCTGIIHYEGRKLKKYRGNLSELVKHRPEAASYYALQDTQQKWVLPEPGFLEGINSKDRAILKMRDVNFKYPTAEKRVLEGVMLQVSLNSRVAVQGPNGAGKSTMIKLLTGELEPESGFVWKHPNLRVAYVAQHAFHHIENHLDKTPNQYIQWRYATGEDREAQKKVDRLTEEEEAELKMQKVQLEGEKAKRTVEKLLNRRKLKKGYEYEVQWQNLPVDQTTWLTRNVLVDMGYEKLVNELDAREAAAAGLMGRPLTAANVEKMLNDLGLEPEFASHSHIRGLSGGQKVKLVLGAAMWQQPHIIVLDEPTNYLDRESLGALASALKEFGGGVVVVSHSQEFLDEVCSEKWTVGGGKLEVTGASAAALAAAKLEWKRQEETTDAFGNTIKIKGPKKELSRKEKKQKDRMKKMRKARGEAVSDSEDEW